MRLGVDLGGTNIVAGAMQSVFGISPVVRAVVSARAEKRRTKAGCSREAADGIWRKLVCWLNGS